MVADQGPWRRIMHHQPHPLLPRQKGAGVKASADLDLYWQTIPVSLPLLRQSVLPCPCRLTNLQGPIHLHDAQASGNDGVAAADQYAVVADSLVVVAPLLEL